MPNFLSLIKGDRDALRKQLEDLADGRYARRMRDGVDTRTVTIEHMRKAIAELDAILARHPGA